jgi:hypothetical protein
VKPHYSTQFDKSVFKPNKHLNPREDHIQTLNRTAVSSLMPNSPIAASSTERGRLIRSGGFQSVQPKEFERLKPSISQRRQIMRGSSYVDKAAYEEKRNGNNKT